MKMVIKIFWKLVLYAAIVGMALMLFAVLLFQQPRIRHTFIHYVAEHLERQTGWHVSFGEVKGWLPFQAETYDVHVVDREGNQLHIEALTCLLSPWELAQGYIAFDYLHIRGAALQLHPAELASRSQLEMTSQAAVSVWEERLGIGSLQLEIKDLSIHGLTVKTPFSQLPIFRLGTVNGACEIDLVQQHAIADVFISLDDKGALPTHLTLAGHLLKDKVFVDLRILEPEKEGGKGGVVNHLLSQIYPGSFSEQASALSSALLPGYTPFELEIQASGSLASLFAHLNAKPLIGTPLIEGQVHWKGRLAALSDKILAGWELDLFETSFCLMDDYVCKFEGAHASLQRIQPADAQAHSSPPLGKQISQTPSASKLAPAVRLETHAALDLHPDGTLLNGHVVAHVADISIFDQNFAACPVDSSLTSSAKGSFYGPADIQVGLSGHISSPRIFVEITSPSLYLCKEEIKRFEARTFINHSGAGFWGSMHIAGFYRSLPIDSSCQFAWDQTEWIKLSQLCVDIPHAHAEGNLSISRLSGLVEGKVMSHVQDVSSYAAMWGQNLKGEAEVETIWEFSSGVSSQSASEQSLKCSVALHHGSYRPDASSPTQNPPDLTVALFEKLSIQAHLKNLMRQPRGTIEIALHKLQAQGIEASLATTIDLEKKIWPFSLSAAYLHDVDLTSFGYWQIDGFPTKPIAKWKCSISATSLSGRAFNKKIILNDTASMAMHENYFVLMPAVFNVEQTSLHVSYAHIAEQVQAMVHTENVPIEWFSPLFTHFPISGNASFSGSLSGSVHSPKGKYTLIAEDVLIHDKVFSKVSPIRVSMEGSLAESHLDTKGSMTGLVAQPITLHARLPVALSIKPFQAAIHREAPFSIHVDAEGEIAHLLQLFASKVKCITGMAHLDLDVRGSVNDPRLHGEIQLSQASYENLDTGAVVGNIAATIVGEGNVLTLKNLSGVAGKSGSVIATGKMLVDLSKNFPFEINANIQKGTLAHMDYAHVNASGPINFFGDLKQATLQGDIAIDSASIMIPKETPAKLQSIDITYINQPPAERKIFEAEKDDFEWPINLDLKVLIPAKTFYVNGRDLHSEWRGKIALKGTTDDPLVYGEADLVGGTFMFNGKSFSSNKGSITFAGDPADKTALYIIAGQAVGDKRIEAILKGPLHDPVLAFRSNPPMSQKDIISWLLFNKGSADITPFEGEKLTETIVTLSGGSDSSDVLGRLRQSIGIDRVDISNTSNLDTNEVSLHVGKYISRGIFVALKRSFTTDANRVSIEANVTSRVKVQAEIGDDAAGRMILKWEKDY